ncbi:hypothetical protein FOA43_000863 [Brettanomyces nanus]|uniref:Uncharacterized protein n=1 Tax=Eeniella nana TaxID=13502 RepID=A0A875RWD8_EENNA|nr:uncharacterized protein FOA43_000863 [Brettanomyces nanus]QPG73551.1 hypothetical protein FOA43_000863 [Brettanomyces nanus]
MDKRNRGSSQLGSEDDAYTTPGPPDISSYSYSNPSNNSHKSQYRPHDAGTIGGSDIDIDEDDSDYSSSMKVDRPSSSLLRRSVLASKNNADIAADTDSFSSIDEHLSTTSSNRINDSNGSIDSIGSIGSKKKALHAESMARNSSSTRFLSFTKKAVRLVGDIAFGPVDDDTYADERRLNLLRARKTELLTQKRKQQLEELRKQFYEFGKEKYLENLRFFLRYMDDSESNDPLNYAVTRKDMWLLWYKKYLLTLKHKIQLYEILIGQKKELKRVSVQSVTDVEKSSNATITDLPPLPSIASIQKNMFQDRRVVLALLWYLQILKKLLHQSHILKDIFRRMQDVNESADPSSSQEMPEICILTSNKLGSSVGKATKDLMKNSIAGSNLEFIDGWNLRHETEDVHINLVTVADTFRKLTDLKNKGYLKPEVLARNLQFKDAPLHKDFYEYQLEDREKRFMENYSSFTTPRVTQIPLADSSQSCIICEDMTSCVDDNDSLLDTLSEFGRVLKHNGSLYLQLWDIDPCSEVQIEQRESRICNSNEYIRYRIWQKLAEYSESHHLALTDITKRIIPALKKAGFKKVHSTLVGYPMLSTLREVDHKVSKREESREESREDAKLETREDSTKRQKGQTSEHFDTHKRERIGSQSTTGTLHSSASEDTRIDSFFEVLSSFTEFLKSVKALRLHGLQSELTVCEQIEILRKKQAEEGEDRSRSLEINRLLESMNQIDKSRLELTKLFIDYKLNGTDSEIVKTLILNGTTFGDSAYISSHDGTINGETRYEGLGYIMLVVAEKA